MKILIFGDVYGRVGRGALIKELPRLQELHKPTFTIVNVENMTSGRGPNADHVRELDDRLDIDIYTLGDHTFDNIDKLRDYLDIDNSKMIRPLNYYETKYYDIPGRGYKILQKGDKKILVINLISETFMRDNVYSPFLKVEELLGSLDTEFDGIIIDFHKEVSSEGYGMAYFLDGRVSFIYGTHTHIQTNDEIILPGGTGLLSDVGMVGPLYSVIGADYESLKSRFLGGIQRGKIEQSLDKNYVVSGVVVDIVDKKSINIEKIRLKGTL